jgi:flagellar biosynthesis protein FlhG
MQPQSHKGINHMMSQTPTKVIAITGGKGGVGKTNIAINLATTLAAQNKHVMLFDADLGLANIDVLLGLNVTKNLYHVIAGEVNLSQIIIQGPKGIKIVPAASGLQRMIQLSEIEHTGLIHAFSELTHDIDYLIIDTAAGISNDVMRFSHAAHEVIVVVCNEPTSITDAYALIKIMNRDYHVKRFQILANMVRHPHEGRDLFFKLSKTTDRFLDVTLTFCGTLPYDDLLRRAVQQQKAVVEAYPGSRSSIAFNQLSQHVTHWPAPHCVEGHIGFFIEKYLAREHATRAMLA